MASADYTKRTPQVGLRGITDPDYNKSKTRNNCFCTISAGGVTLGTSTKTFDEEYKNSAGKPTPLLDSVKISTSGEDRGLIRQVEAQFTCYTKGQFDSVEATFFVPDAAISVNYGYVNPVGGGGSGGSITDCNIAKFSVSVDQQNRYKCSVTAFGPTKFMEEVNLAQAIFDGSLEIDQPGFFGSSKTPVTGVASLIEYDAQKGLGMMSSEVDNGTVVNVDGGTICIWDEPRTGILGKILNFLPDFLTPDPRKMLYVDLNWIVNRFVNNQILTKVSGTLAGRKIKIDATGFWKGGLVSADPMQVVWVGSGCGHYHKPGGFFGDELGKDFEDNDGIAAVGGSSPADLSNCFFNKDAVVEALTGAKTDARSVDKSQKTGADPGKGGGEISLRSFFDHLFGLLREASGGLWSLGLMENPKNSQEMLVINYKDNKGGIGALTFDPINGDGSTRSTNMQCSPDMGDVYHAMVNHSKNQAELTERLKGGNAASNDNGAMGKISKITRNAMPNDGFSEDARTDLKAAITDLINGLTPGERTVTSYPFPYTLEVTMDGVEGWQFGDVISSTLLPSSAQSAGVCFRVVEFSHDLSKNDWSTTVRGVMDFN